MTVGVMEILLVLLLVLFFFGAKRIPVIGRGIGEGIRNFKGALSDKESLGEGDDSPGDRTLEEPADHDRS